MTASRESGKPAAGLKTITIKSVNADFEREPLVRPFGFKGIYQKQFWVAAALLESTSGIRHVGLQTQCPAWSDLDVFLAHSESGRQSPVVRGLGAALQNIKGMKFTTPIELRTPSCKARTNMAERSRKRHLRMTFTLSSMVALDNAAWMLYAEENGLKTFDEMIPKQYRKGPGVSSFARGPCAAVLLQRAFGRDREAVDEGYFFMKIKIGRPGTQEEMLEGDKARIEAIHKLIGHRETPHTKNGKIPYYFDANGRYEKKETLERLLDHAKKRGHVRPNRHHRRAFPRRGGFPGGRSGGADCRG